MVAKPATKEEIDSIKKKDEAIKQSLKKDTAYINLEYKNNIKVFIKNSWLSPIKIRSIKLKFEKAILYCDENEPIYKIKEKELNKLNVTVHPETYISKIDKKNKVITDSHNEKHTFDKLILATGSRAFIPRDVQIDLPGRFTMRNKSDADSFKRYLDATGLPPEEQHIAIVGGGLLGLELAAAMKHKNAKITIIQRASRLMERQLDKVSSKLLALDVQERGIQIYFDNEVSTVFDDDDTGEINITLKSKALCCSFMDIILVFRITLNTANAH